jgi:adenylosuccinate synthase
MPLDIIVGAQWGDEGKGRITDMLASAAALVARYSGGDNAGHTVTLGQEVFKLHLIPSGIIHPGVVCLLGNGVVVNPAVMLAEMEQLAARGINVSPDRLKLSQRAHLITPAHVALDRAEESRRGREAIGTTGRGIGPAYADKSSRAGLQAGLLATPEALADAIHGHVTSANRLLDRLYGLPPLDADRAAALYAEYAYRLAPHLVDGSMLLDDYLRRGHPVLAEGAQGTLLDLDHGTYPYVTSSSPTAGGALVGLGVGPRWVGRILGVAKAFTTRVGSGPFPCELGGELAEGLRGTGANPWDEFGTTTGRPRRVGWLDTVILRYAARVNGLTELALTKLDVLSGLKELPVCVGYERDGERLEHLPASAEALAGCHPIYNTLAGWDEDISQARRPSDLPGNARRYIDQVAEWTGVPVSLISVGPGRDQYVPL